MNAIAAHKDELEKLLGDLSSDRVLSGITFVALVDAYITRLDTNCTDVSARVNPSPAQIDGELTYGTNIDSKPRALLRATQNFKTTRCIFPKISRRGPQTSAGYLRAAAARQTLRARGPFPGQRTLIDVNQQVKHDDGVTEIKNESGSSSQNRSAVDNFRGKPKYLFRGIVK